MGYALLVAVRTPHIRATKLAVAGTGTGTGNWELGIGNWELGTGTGAGAGAGLWHVAVMESQLFTYRYDRRTFMAMLTEASVYAKA
ncbi:hypothetical protein MBM_05828 [Drepanopeziza brunnea f. sp. 'multigermtubi' MB_m1]|uniref:Uncharacterized protein n=1 Tax=Marssonina brunnea f. sp. multigermtubi (strain MB_m1) TaxID=1072389 RepID=K1WTP0_MARBU|nr:uncharacterized protein MBM_05828 [Drepanopeziza brunnea f. sp. 'multigermtubi' MB_m1]EKD15817.1 hypothetical protein MBM_05828 [Drepanopeziza brunnea f. sp. 'multigermtubi' MB_m1]